MVTEPRPLINSDLLRQVEGTAREQNLARPGSGRSGRQVSSQSNGLRAVSQPILDEMADVRLRKFYATPGKSQKRSRSLGFAARIVRPAVQLNVIKEDPDDDRILECAVSAGSDYIITGDKHLLRMGRYDSVKPLPKRMVRLPPLIALGPYLYEIFPCPSDCRWAGRC